MSVVENVLCSKTHEWVLEDNGVYTIGLTDFAVEQLGDIVFVELPEVGATFSKNETFGTIESVKAASEIYMPISGEVVEVNDSLLDMPEKVNNNPWEDGWLIKVKSETAASDISDLLDYEDYREEVE